MIKAIGVKKKKKLTVECEKQGKYWLYTFDGEINGSYEQEIEILLMDEHPLIGTYWPVCDALKIAAALPYFFDRGGLEMVEIDDPEAEKELSDIEYDEKAVY